MPVNESYLYGCMSTVSLRQQRKLKGTVVCCVGCGRGGITLYKCDLGYICKACKKRMENSNE